MATKTLTVEHEGSHEPSKDQIRAALTEALKDSDVKRKGDFDYTLVENTSNGPSQVRVTYDTDEASSASTTTKTVGGK